MHLLIFLQIINILFLVRDPDELFTTSDTEHYVITAETVTLDETDEGRVSHLIGNVTITHGKTIITGDEGYAYEIQQMAEVQRNVRIDDEATIITAAHAKYFKDERMAVLTDSVELRDGKQLLKTDSLVYFKTRKFSEGYGNVVLIDKERNTEVKGNYGEYDFVDDAGFITDNPELILFEKAKKITVSGDTLRIKRKENFMSCKGNVKVKEDSITATAGYLEYFSDSGRMYLNEKPFIEQSDKSTLSGSSIEVFLKNREITKTVAMNDANGKYQLSNGATNNVQGDTISILFEDGKTARIIVVGNTNGLYRKVSEGEKKSE